jgi:hypothetical protein
MQRKLFLCWHLGPDDRLKTGRQLVVGACHHRLPDFLVLRLIQGKRRLGLRRSGPADGLIAVLSGNIGLLGHQVKTRKTRCYDNQKPAHVRSSIAKGAAASRTAAQRGPLLDLTAFGHA